MHSPGVFDKQKGSVKINFLQIERYLGGLESCLSSPRFPGREVTCVLGAPTFKPACSIWRTGHGYRWLTAIFYSAQAERNVGPLNLSRRRLQHEQTSPAQRNRSKRCLGFAGSHRIGFQPNTRES